MLYILLNVPLWRLFSAVLIEWYRYTIGFALMIKLRLGKPTVSPKKQWNLRIITAEFIEQRLQKIHDTCRGIICSISKLDFQKVSGNSIIADQRVITVILIVKVKAFAFLMTIGIQESRIQIQCILVQPVKNRESVGCEAKTFLARTAVSTGSLVSSSAQSSSKHAPSLQANSLIRSRPASEDKSPPSKFIFKY